MHGCLSITIMGGKGAHAEAWGRGRSIPPLLALHRLRHLTHPCLPTTAPFLTHHHPAHAPPLFCPSLTAPHHPPLWPPRCSPAFLVIHICEAHSAPPVSLHACPTLHYPSSRFTRLDRHLNHACHVHAILHCCSCCASHIPSRCAPDLLTQHVPTCGMHLRRLVGHHTWHACILPQPTTW